MKYIKIIILSLILIGFVFVFTGCEESTAQTENRFVVVSNEGTFITCYEKTTKVMYAVSNGYYNSGNVTLLVDQEGKPLLYKGE